MPEHVLYIPDNDSACLRSRTYVFVRVTKFVGRKCEIETGFINVILFGFIIAPCIMESIYCSLTNKCTFY